MSAPDDGAARILLQRAQGAFQKWPEFFGGFRARLAVNAAGSERSGWVEVGPDGAVEVALADADLSAWARTTLEALAAERRPAFFKDHDGRFPIAFDEDGPADTLGHLVVVRRGEFGDIRYRIDDRARVRQRVALYRKVSFPFVTIVMTLIAVPFAVTIGRSGAMAGIGVGIAIALAYWTTILLFSAMGSGGLLAPALAAWAPNLLFGVGAAYLLLTVRT